MVQCGGDEGTPPPKSGASFPFLPAHGVSPRGAFACAPKAAGETIIQHQLLNPPCGPERGRRRKQESPPRLFPSNSVTSAAAAPPPAPSKASLPEGCPVKALSQHAAVGRAKGRRRGEARRGAHSPLQSALAAFPLLRRLPRRRRTTPTSLRGSPRVETAPRTPRCPTTPGCAQGRWRREPGSAPSPS